MLFHRHTADCNCPTPHDNTSAQKARPLWIALGLVGGFAAIEFTAGILSRSLALTAEAGHMLSDCLSLGVALLATWVAALPASDRAPFGYRRVEILAALLNGLGLVALSLWIGWEAIERLQQPAADEVLALPMLITAAIGVGVNTLNATLLHDHSHHDLNLRGAFLHMIADAISAVGVLLAAIAIWLFHWNWADGAISLVVAVFIIIGAIPLIGESINILMEKSPSYIDKEQLREHLLTFTGVVGVDGLRLWSIAPGQEVLTVKLLVSVKDGSQRDRLLADIQTSLMQKFGIQQSFLQMTAPAIGLNLSRPERLDVCGGVGSRE